MKVVQDDRFGDSSWEIKETMRETYPYLFIACQFFRTKIFLVGKNVRTEKNSLSKSGIIKMTLEYFIIKFKRAYK